MLEILQTEESTTKTLSTIGADTQKIHYARYDKKKLGSKGGKQKSGQPSTFKNPTPNLWMDLCVTDVERHSQRNMTKCARLKLPNVTPARQSDIIQSVA